jgi:(2Fe-2S) ferredoxin
MQLSYGCVPWDGRLSRWRRDVNSKEITPAEYQLAATELHQHLLSALGQPDKWPLVYPIANFFGEATQQIAVDSPQALSSELITACQEWLNRDHRKDWRCIIETNCKPETTLVVYPDCVIYGQDLSGTDVEKLARLRLILSDYVSQNGIHG